MSELITCVVEGVTFSFRKPRFENYQATHLIPPKSAVLGLITHALNRGESLYYQIQNDLKYATILLQVQSRYVDLWTAIQGKGDESGKRGIFYREHFFKASFRFYFYSEQYTDLIFQALKQPQNIVYLGKSEDLVKIHSVQKIPLIKEESNRIREVLPLDFMPLIQTIDWKNTYLRQLFPPAEESLIDSYMPPVYHQAIREQRSVRKTNEVYVALDGEFVLNQPVTAIRVEEGHVCLI